MTNSPGNKLSFGAVLIVLVLGGSIGGIIGNFLAAALIRWTGSWLGGRADFDECRAALAWASVPQVVNIALMLLLLCVIGEGLFKSDGLEGAEPWKGLLLVAVGVTQIVLGCWMIFLILKTVAEVHRFSAWKSLGALLLAALVFVAVIMVIVLAGAAGIAVLRGGR